MIKTTFSWQTTCNHINHPIPVGLDTILKYNHPIQSNVHNFVISTQDDYCPVPGKNVKTITIVLLKPPILKPPTLTCDSVGSDGSVTLNWEPIKNTSGFYAYLLYTSTSLNGPYTLLDSIKNVNQSTYHDPTNKANNQVVYYYMQTVCSCFHDSISVPGDTLATILLNITPNPGIAILNWNSNHTHASQTDSLKYEIYREYTPNKWSLIGETIKTSYSDTIAGICKPVTINYQIRYPDESGCASYSDISGGIYHDTNPPDTTVLDTVSVDTNSRNVVHISWKLSSSKDTRGYVIYKLIKNTWTPIDTVYSSSRTEWDDSASNAYSSSQLYRVAPFDSCLNLATYSIPQKTIYLTASFDICTNSIVLNWDKYINMKNLMGYRVYYKMNNAPTFTLLTTTTANVTNCSQTNLVKQNIYCYAVQAFDSAGTKTSTSNLTCLVARTMNEPQYSYLRYATVVWISRVISISM